MLVLPHALHNPNAPSDMSSITFPSDLGANFDRNDYVIFTRCPPYLQTRSHVQHIDTAMEGFILIIFFVHLTFVFV